MIQLTKADNFTAENIVVSANATIKLSHDLFDNQTVTVTFTPVE